MECKLREAFKNKKDKTHGIFGLPQDNVTIFISKKCVSSQIINSMNFVILSFILALFPLSLFMNFNIAYNSFIKWCDLKILSVKTVGKNPFFYNFFFFGGGAPSRATYLDLHDETLVYFFRLVAVFERIVQIIRLFE